MTKQTLRNMVINLLDDEDGVNESGYNGLDEICCENNWTDILTQVESAGRPGRGRFFLSEDASEQLRSVVVDN